MLQRGRYYRLPCGRSYNGNLRGKPNKQKKPAPEKTPGRALLCLRQPKTLEYQGFLAKKMHSNSIKITVHWCCICPKRCVESGYLPQKYTSKSLYSSAYPIFSVRSCRLLSCWACVIAPCSRKVFRVATCRS